MKLNVRRGFTLAEVLVTVTITAVLAAVVVPSVVNQVKKGDNPSFVSEIQAISTSVNQFATDNRALPATLGDLVAAPSSLTATWKGPYLSTGQDLSTTTSVYTAAAYGLTYFNTIPPVDSCAPHNYMPLSVKTVNGQAISGLTNTDPTFKSLYDAMYNVTTDPPATSTAGPLQYPDASTHFSNLYVCMIAAKVS